MNDPNTPEGFTIAQTFNEDGQRVTTARAFLKPKSERPNLSVKLNAHVIKVIIENNKTVGVVYVDDQGQTKSVRAAKEVILSAGSLNTPHILMHSGIGPKETLEKYNIPVNMDLPVGQNLQNHYGITLYFLLKNMNGTNVLDWSVLLEYLLKQTGPMTATGFTQLTGLLYSSLANKDKKQPDLQFFFNGFLADCSETGVIGLQKRLNVSANAAALQPRSVGQLTINSSNPLDPPLFNPGYFSHPEDMVMIKDGAKYLQRIFNSSELEEYGITTDPLYTTVCDGAGESWSDPWIECMARHHTDPQNHQIGTAAMNIVVDSELKVFGIDGLRVIDASVIPCLPTGSPQGQIMMVAERGATFIKEQWGY